MKNKENNKTNNKQKKYIIQNEEKFIRKNMDVIYGGHTCEVGGKEFIGEDKKDEWKGRMGMTFGRRKLVKGYLNYTKS